VPFLLDVLPNPYDPGRPCLVFAHALLHPCLQLRLLLAAKDGVGFVYLLEPLLGFGILVLIRMEYQGEAAVGLLYLLSARPFPDAENPVVVFRLNHRFPAFVQPAL